MPLFLSLLSRNFVAIEFLFTKIIEIPQQLGFRSVELIKTLKNNLVILCI